MRHGLSRVLSGIFATVRVVIQTEKGTSFGQVNIVVLLVLAALALVVLVGNFGNVILALWAPKDRYIPPISGLWVWIPLVAVGIACMWVAARNEPKLHRPRKGRP